MTASDHARSQENRSQEDRLTFYGRRHGRRLRTNQAAFLAEGQAQFAIPSDILTDKADLDPRDWMNPSSGEVFLEIGFGGGEHLAARAKESPDRGFIGAEPFMNGVASLCRHLIEGDLSNVRIWPEDVRLLLPSLKDGCLDGAFVLFPDPWPKSRHQSRRIIQQDMITTLARLIRPQGQLLLASDDPTAKSWMLEQMMRRDDFIWTAETANDWRTPPQGWPGTRYMAKAEKAQRKSAWFTFIRQ